MEDRSVKFCPDCRRLKRLTEFHKDAHAVDGYRAYCKDCIKKRRSKLGHQKGLIRPGRKRCPRCQRVRMVRQFGKGAKPGTLSAWCSECTRKYQRMYRQTHPHTPAAIKKWRRTLGQHRLSKTGYAAMVEEQGGVCAICGGTNGDKGLCIDHDHETGLVRGLLCNLCNSVLGYAKDDTDTLATAITYLKKSQRKVSTASA